MDKSISLAFFVWNHGNWKVIQELKACIVECSCMKPAFRKGKKKSNLMDIVSPVNRKKDICLSIGGGERGGEGLLSGKLVKKVEEFIYLGSMPRAMGILM